MGEDDELDLEVAPIASVAFDRDAVATALMAMAASQAKAMHNFFVEMSYAYAAQSNKNQDDIALHDEVTLSIESLPTTEE